MRLDRTKPSGGPRDRAPRNAAAKQRSMYSWNFYGGEAGIKIGAPKASGGPRGRAPRNLSPRNDVVSLVRWLWVFEEQERW